jgi:ankyrin repeat protein
MRGKVVGMALCGLVLGGCQPSKLEVGSGLASEQKMMQGGRELVWAIADGDVEKAKQLADWYWVPVLPVPHKIPMGDRCFFPIHAAAGAGEVEIVKVLIARGADVNARDNGGLTPIMWAVGRAVPVKKGLEDLNASHIACIRELVKAGADVNAGTRYRWTALHWVSLNNPEVMPFIRELVRLGADVNRTNRGGETPLHVWCRLIVDNQDQFREGVRYLLEHGADVCVKDNEGRYAEQWLNEKVPQQKEVIELIREARRRQEKGKQGEKPGPEGKR